MTPPRTHLGAQRWLLAWLGIAALALTTWGCEGRPRTTASGKADELTSNRSSPHVAELDLRRGVPESPSSSLLSPSSDSFPDLIEQLRQMDHEDELSGVFVRVGTSNMSFARADEIGRRLAKLRKDKGIAVTCHADGYTNATTLLAARGCDEIWLSPAGNVDSIGIAAQLLFGRSLLEYLEVDVDFLQVGKYKGAEEPFTRDESSPEARKSLETALRGMRRGWIDGVEKGRDKSAAELGLEDGPHTAEAAKKLGLIDEIGFEQEAKDRALERAGVSSRVSYYGGKSSDDDGIGELLRLLSGTRSLSVPHIALVVATGAISMDGGGGLLGGGDGIEERQLSRTLKKLADDESTKAVVLRIDSPGGSALASDLLWHQVMKLRAEKPVVVSVGGMAASGGYYIACAGNKIVAERTSIIGSIGVVAGKLSFARTLAEMGIHVESVPAAGPEKGQRALYASALSGWDDATRAKVLAAIENMYDLFVARIAEGRDMKKERIAAAAEGRIMAGEDARKAGLVDEIGGLERAIGLAIELSEAEPDIAVQTVKAPSGLAALLGDVPQSRAAAVADLEQRARRETLEALGGALVPYRSEIATYASSMAPLVNGERVVVALPYALAIR